MREIIIGRYSGSARLPNAAPTTRRAVEERGLREFLADICDNYRFALGTEGERKYHEFLAAILPGWKPPATASSNNLREAEWDPSKHPRGGNPNNPGEFSLGWGVGGEKTRATLAQNIRSNQPLVNPFPRNRPGNWPERPPTIRYDPKSPVQAFDKTKIGTAFEREITQAHAALPDQVKTDLQRLQVPILLEPNLDETRKKLIARGHAVPNGVLGGLYDDTAGVIHLPENRDRGGWKTGNLYHEIGHLYDHEYRLSERPEILQAYVRDREAILNNPAIPEETKRQLAHPLKNVNEAVATLIAHDLTFPARRETELGKAEAIAPQHFPNTHAQLRQALQGKRILR